MVGLYHGETDKTRTTSGATVAHTFFEAPSDKVIYALPGATEHRLSLEGGRKGDNGLAQSLQEQDFNVYTLDLPGQGQSSGSLAHQNAQSDLYETITTLNEHHNFNEQRGFGNSIGGLLLGQLQQEQNMYETVSASSVPHDMSDVIPSLAGQLWKLTSGALGTLVTGTLNATESEHRQVSKQIMSDQPQWYLGATKLSHDVLTNLHNYPRLDESYAGVTVPTAFHYGSNDTISFNHDVETLPQRYQDAIPRNASAELYNGLDHSLNETTPTDKPFNVDRSSSRARQNIIEHFTTYLQHD